MLFCWYHCVASETWRSFFPDTTCCDVFTDNDNDADSGCEDVCVTVMQIAGLRNDRKLKKIKACLKRNPLYRVSLLELAFHSSLKSRKMFQWCATIHLFCNLHHFRDVGAEDLWLSYWQPIWQCKQKDIHLRLKRSLQGNGIKRIYGFIWVLSLIGCLIMYEVCDGDRRKQGNINYSKQIERMNVYKKSQVSTSVLGAVVSTVFSYKVGISESLSNAAILSSHNVTNILHSSVELFRYFNAQIRAVWIAVFFTLCRMESQIKCAIHFRRALFMAQQNVARQVVSWRWGSYVSVSLRRLLLINTNVDFDSKQEIKELLG